MSPSPSRSRSQRSPGPHPPGTGGEIASLDWIAFLSVAVIATVGGIVVAANAEAEALFGYATGELDGQPVETLVPHVHRQDHERQRSAYAARPTRRQMHASGLLHGLRRDGSTVPIEVSLSPARLDGERVVVAVINDLTPQVLQQARLRESEQRYRALVENAAEGVIVVDPADWSIVDANEPMAALVGISVADLSTTRLDALSPRHPMAALDRFRQALSGKVPGIGWTLRGQGGTEIPVELRLARMRVDGRPLVRISVVDLTASQHQARETARARDLLAQSLRLARMGYWIEDLEKGVVHTSPEFRAMVGTDRRTMTFAELTGWVHPDDRAALVPIRERGLRGEESAFDFRLVTESGRVVAARAIAANVAGDPSQRLGVVQDVTALKDAEESLHHLRRTEAVGKLAGGIAHDFNNLLTAISGFVHLAGMQDRDDAARTLQHATEAIQRASDLTQQLLAVSRRQRLRLEPVSLTREVESIQPMLRRLLPETIAIDLDLDPDLPPCLADAGSVSQLVINLATNARDAMPEGGRLTIRTAPSSDRQHVEIRVVDDGAGIPEEILERIFEPFYTTKAPGSGTGLGLPIVEATVAELGGTLALESRIGHGTSVTLTLPVTDQPLPDGTRTADDVPAPARGRLTGTILVSEDHDAVRDLLLSLLRADGHRVVESVDGVDALEAARRSDVAFDLLITDLVMPRMGGRELARRIRAAAPDIDVIVCSGYDPGEFTVRAADGGPDRFLAKPYKPTAMLELVQEVLRGREERRAPRAVTGDTR